MPSDLYIGLMSGTSLDGVDAVLVDFSGSKCLVTHHQSAPLAPELRAQLWALNTPGPDELHRSALAANALARTYAQAVQALLADSGTPAQAIRALGAHGQTVRHRPQAFDGTGYTLQLNNPALLAELTGITVVADFRSRDVAAGGQGAPLVPAFHQQVFWQPGQSALVLNIGGIANLSVLGADGSVLGFDCGPGNALMDYWCQQHTGQPLRPRWRLGRQRPSAVRTAGAAASRALFAPAAAQKHGPRPVQPRLADSAIGRHGPRRAARRASHIDRIDRKRLRIQREQLRKQ